MGKRWEELRYRLSAFGLTSSSAWNEKKGRKNSQLEKDATSKIECDSRLVDERTASDLDLRSDSCPGSIVEKISEVPESLGKKVEGEVSGSTRRVELVARFRKTYRWLAFFPPMSRIGSSLSLLKLNRRLSTGTR